MMDEAPHAPEDRVGADLLQLVLGFQISQAIRVVATLGVADLLASGPKSSTELAAATGMHPSSLHRLMRALAAVSVFHEDPAHGFSLTPTGSRLRSDIAGTCAPMADLMGRPSTWQAWGDLIHAVRTGDAAFDRVHGHSVWEHRARHPQEAEVFDRAMAVHTEWFVEALLAVCDFGRFAHVVDIGGGDGTLLAGILAACPGSRGTLLDLPKTAARAEATFARFGLSTRAEAFGGDFLVSVPEDGDAYVLKSILHAWDDTTAADILSRCRRAMRPGARLIVIEHVIGPPNAGVRAKFMDLNMLVMNGGRERTLDEFAALFGQSGFRLTAVVPTAAAVPLTVIEGVPEGASMA